MADTDLCGIHLTYNPNCSTCRSDAERATSPTTPGDEYDGHESINAATPDAERGEESGCDCACNCTGVTHHWASCSRRPAPLAEPDTDDAQPATQRCWKELGRSDTQPHLVAVCAKPEGHEGECLLVSAERWNSSR